MSGEDGDREDAKDAEEADEIEDESGAVEPLLKAGKAPASSFG